MPCVLRPESLSGADMEGEEERETARRGPGDARRRGGESSRAGESPVGLMLFAHVCVCELNNT